MSTFAVLRGETTKVEAARQHGLTVHEIEGWEEAAMTAVENALLVACVWCTITAECITLFTGVTLQA